MPSVSVIVPVYNAEKYIHRCVDSILAQTFTDFELILVNDGSSDRSWEILHEYEQKDSRVRVITQENQGPDYARKVGIERSSSDWLMFCDGDDYIAPEMLQRLYDEMIISQADMVCSHIIRFDEKGNTWEIEKKPAEALYCESTTDILYHYFVTRYISSSYDTKLIRKELFEQYEFCKVPIIGEDVCAVLYLLQKARKVRILNEAYYYYFWNLGSISHSGYTKKHEAAFYHYVDVKQALIEKNCIDKRYIVPFFAEYEMAVITAMCRNWKRNKQVIIDLRLQLKNELRLIWRNSGTALYMKMSILLFVLWPKLFMVCFRILHLLTGR